MLECISNSPANLLANAFLNKNKTSTGLWLLSGPRSAGKTTFCQELSERMRENGASVGGILCPAVYTDNEKTGIDQINIATGERRWLGIPARQSGERTVGCWLMNRSVFDWGNEILAGLKDEDLIVIDELGPLEFEQGFGYQAGMRLLDEKRYQTALVVVRPSLLSLARQRWPQTQILELGGR